MSHLRSTSVSRSSGLLLSVAFALLGACSPGTTDKPTTGDDAGADNLPPCSLGSTTADIEKKLFQGVKCLVCHSKATTFPTSMDTVSPGLADRVIDKMAEASSAKGKCAGRDLAPKDDPTSGLFYEKVSGTPKCGDRMPMSMSPLSADEISCVKRWLIMAAKAAP